MVRVMASALQEPWLNGDRLAFSVPKAESCLWGPSLGMRKESHTPKARYRNEGASWWPGRWQTLAGLTGRRDTGEREGRKEAQEEEAKPGSAFTLACLGEVCPLTLTGCFFP